MQLVPLAPAHANDAARLHIAGQPDTFLTSLGPDVLAALYRAISAIRSGFGFAAIDEQGMLLGFTSATTGVGKLFAEIGTTQLGTLLPPLVGQVTRHPSLLWRSMQTVAYPLLAGGREAGLAPAELLSIMVEPSVRSQGIGAQLLTALCDACASRGIALLDVTVDAGNQGAQRFYQRHGFVHHHNFTLYGRPMAQYRLAVSPSSPSARE